MVVRFDHRYVFVHSCVYSSCLLGGGCKDPESPCGLCGVEGHPGSERQTKQINIYLVTMTVTHCCSENVVTPRSSCSACYACSPPLCLRRQVRSLCALKASQALSHCMTLGTILVFDVQRT